MNKIEKVICTVYYGTAFSFFCTAYAHAYIDPSVVTYSAQIIAGILVAVGAVAGILWRKAKKKIGNRLGIDENRNKEIESDDISVSTNDAAFEEKN